MKKYILMILSLLSILYGVLILQVGSGTGFWIIWEMIGVFFFIWAILLQKKFFDSRRTLKIIFHSMIIVVLAVITMLGGMITTEFKSKGHQNLDYIIVLGAQVRENGPSVVLQYRLDAAIEYLNKNPDTICIVSGGQGANEPFSEAEGMAKYLLENGIEMKRILLEDKSRNTVENIQNSKDLMGESYNGVGIITNNFHVFRAMQIAKMQELKGVSGIAADSNALYLPNNMLRECCGILKDWFMNHI